MLLRTKFKLLVVFLFIFFATAEAVILRYVVLDSFIRLEQDEAFKDIQRIEHAINREVHHLGLICHDWSSWDDMYEFVNDMNHEFINSTLIYNSFKANNCNLIVILDNSLKMVWGKIYDLDKGVALNLEKFTGNKKLSEILFLKSSLHQDDANNHGVIKTEYGPMLIVSRPIRKSTESGLPNGVLVMGRFLGVKTIIDLIDQTKVEFKIIYPVKKESYQRMECFYSEDKGKREKYYVEKMEDKIRIIKDFKDVDHSPAFLIEVLLPRGITEKGLQTLNFSAGYIVASGITILFVFAFILRNRVFFPLEKMACHMGKIEEVGDFSLRLGIKRRDEIGILANVFDKLIDKIECQTLELLRVNSVLKDLSSIDELTQISNRRIFNQHFEYEWKRMKREKKPLSIILCDIDFFKLYNDHYGHQAGDECLKKVASMLKKAAQRSCDLVARYGGEEFVIVLSGTASEGAECVAETIINDFKREQIPHEASIVSGFVSVSLGIASAIPSDTCQCEEILKIADQALYKAKANGRNRYETIAIKE